MKTIPCARSLSPACANRRCQLTLKPGRYFRLFLLLLTISLSACADPIRQDIKVQFVHAQTLKPLQGVFASVEWMDVKTGICKRHSVLRSDAQGRVYFKKVPGAYARPMNAMGLDLQTINREIDNKTGRPKHRMMNGRNPSEIPWEKMVLSLGYQKIDVQEHSSLYYDLWLPEDAITPLNGYVRSYMLSTRQTPFSASQYYTRIGGPCIYRQYDEKTGKNVESVDRSEYTEETRQALLRTKALAQYQLLCDARWEGVFLAYEGAQFAEVLSLVDTPENWESAWAKFKEVVPSYDGRYMNFRPFTPIERTQFCGWIAKEIENDAEV